MQTRWLAVILLLALVLRLALLAAAWRKPQRLITPDSPGYIELSHALAEGHFRNNSSAEINRTPGYPFFLLIGTPFGQQWWLAVAAAQIVIDVFLVYVTFLLGSMLCGPRVGLWAALLGAISPVSIAASVRILSEGLFAFLLTTAILLVVHHFGTARRWSLLAGVAIAAIACYVRPTGLASLAVIAIVLAGRIIAPNMQKEARRLALCRLLAALAVMFTIVSPWIVRNGLRTHYWGFSAISTENLLRYEAAAVAARLRKIPITQARSDLEAQVPPLSAALSDYPQRLSKERSRVAMEVLGAHPLTWTYVHAVTSLATFLPGITDVLEIAGLSTSQRGTLAVLQDRGLLAAVDHYFEGHQWALRLTAAAALLLAFKYFLAVICAMRYLRLRMCAGFYLVFWMILVLAFLGGPASTARFRVPFEPLLSVAAAAGLVFLFARPRRGPFPATPTKVMVKMERPATRVVYRGVATNA